MSIITPSRGLIIGHGNFDLWSEEGYKAHLAGDPLAQFGDLVHGEFRNLITNAGDEYYAERAAGIASPPAQVTGMQLGTGTTAVAKNGAGAAMVTPVNTTDALQAIDATWPTSNGLQSGATACRIQWKTTWAAAEATGNSIAEVVLSNQSLGTQTAVPAAACISRALLSPTVNKAAADTLAVTWNHDLLGA